MEITNFSGQVFTGENDKKIMFVGGVWSALSNLAAYQINFNGVDFPTVEHAYHYHKFTDPKLQKQILGAKSARQAMMISRQNRDQQRSDWNDISLGLMEQFLRAKLEQHPDIAEKLIRSGDREIIEATDETFWGAGKDGLGRNMLGKLWMKLREELI